jgi:hypothetical protein
MWKQVRRGFQAEQWVVHVALSRRSREYQAEDVRANATGCIGFSTLTLPFSMYWALGAF